MNTTEAVSVERIFADHTVTKRLGNWTAANAFAVQARRSSIVLDLRSHRIADAAGTVSTTVDLDHAVVTLLVGSNDTVDFHELRWSGRGRVSDGGPIVEAAAGAARNLTLTGSAADSQIRVRRGGVANILAMLSRDYLRELRTARRTGTYPTIDDPNRAAQQRVARKEH